MDEVEIPERDRIGELKRERVALQQKTFTKWVNAFLEKTGAHVQNLFTDFTDGKLLIKLLENISGAKIGIVSKGKQRIHKLENVSRVLEYLKKFIKLESIGAEDIVDGKEELILGLLWTIILRFSIADVQEESRDSKSVKDALLLWCQRKTKGYAGVNIVNFTSCWKNGLAFNALIHAHRPDLFDFNDLNGSQHIKNLAHAFDVASEKLGIAKLLDPEDVDVPRPDEKSIMMYIGMIYQYFSKLQHEKTSGKRLNKFVMELMELDRMKETYIRMVDELLVWLHQTTDSLSKPVPTTLSQLHMDMNDFKLFRTDEKPKRSMNRMKAEILFFEIQAFLTGKRYKSYIPTKGYTLSDVNITWQNLEKTENIREGKLKTELLRQEKLSMLLEKFNIKASLRESWLSDKNIILDMESKPDQIAPRDIPSSLKKHQGFEADLKAGEIRFSVLSRLLEDMTTLKYHDVAKLTCRKEQILKDWLKLLQKVSARKKSLLSLKNLSSIIVDLDDLKFEMNTFQNFSLNHHGKSVIAVKEMIEIHEQDIHHFKSYCYRFEELERRVEGQLKTNSQLSTEMKKKLAELGEIKQIRHDQCEEKSKNLDFSQTINYFLHSLIDLNTTLSDKLRVAETREVGQDLMSLNKYKRKHQVLISEANSCFYQCDQLLQQWMSITTKPLDVERVEQEIKVLQETCCKFKNLVNGRSKLLIEAKLSLTYYVNASYAELWINEKLQLITTENIFESKIQTEFFLKRLSDIQYEITIFKHEIDILQSLSKKIDRYESPDLDQEENELPSLTLPLPLHSESFRNHSENESFITHFDRENVSSRQLQLFDSYLNLQKICQDKMKFLELHLNYQVFLQNHQELISSLTEIELAIDTMDLFNDEIEALKRKTKECWENLKLCRNISVSKENEASSLETHPDYENVALLKQQLFKKFSEVTVSLEKLDQDIFKLHGVNTFLSDCEQLCCWIKEKEDQLYSEYDADNEYVVRQELKKQQGIEKEIDAIKNKKAAIKQDYDKLVESGNVLPKVAYDKLEEVKKKVESVSILSLERSNALTMAYGIQGFMADANDLSFCIKGKESLLSDPIVADTLSDVNQCIILNEQEKELARHLTSDVNEVIALADSISRETSVETTIKHLRDGMENIHYLIASRDAELEKKKTFLKNCKELQRIKSHLSSYEILLDHISLETESLQVSRERLLERYNEVKHKKHSDLKKLASLKTELNTSTTTTTTTTTTCQILFNLLEETENLLCDVETKSDLVESELNQLKAFQDFNGECGELISWIQEKKGLLTCSSLNDLNVNKKKSHHKNIWAEMTMQGALKRKMEEKGFLLIEDCHFASNKITDLLHEVDGKWFELEQIFRVKEEELSDSQISDEVQTNMKNFTVWLDASQKKLGKPVANQDLSSCRSMLLNHNKMESEIRSQAEVLERLLEDGEKLKDSDMKQKLNDDVKNAQLKLKDLDEACKKKRITITKDLECQEFFQKSSFEFLWISDQLAKLSSFTKTKDLISVRQTKNSLTAIEHQLITRQEAFNKLLLQGEKLSNNSEDHCHRISENINDLKNAWDTLSKNVLHRTVDLNLNLSELEYLSEADVHIEWVEETISHASSAEYGKDLSSCDRLLKKHKILLADILKYKRLLKVFFQSRKERETTKAIQNKSKLIKSKFKKLENIAEARQRNLHSSYNLLYFYQEAGNLKSVLTDLHKNMSSDNYSENYDQACAMNEKFEHFCLSIPSAQKLFQKVHTLGSNLCHQNHPHKETIEGVLEKLCNLWKRFDGKVNQRRSRLLKACYFHKLNKDIINVCDHLTSYTDQLSQFGDLEGKSSYQLQNELHQLKLCVKDEHLLNEELAKIDEHCKEMLPLYPGKSLEKLLKQKDDLKTTFKQKNCHHDRLCDEYEEKIKMADFSVELQSLASSCQTFEASLSQLENTAIDCYSTKDALSDLKVIMNQHKAKEDKLTCLQKTLCQLKIDEEEKDEFTRQLDTLTESYQSNVASYEDMLKTLNTKLSVFSLKKDVHKVKTTLSSLDVSVNMEHVDSGVHFQRLQKAERHLVLLSAQIKSLFEVNTKVDAKESADIKNKLACLSVQRKELSEKVLQSKTQLEKKERFALFCVRHSELKHWVEDKSTSCNKNFSNLNHSMRIHKRLHADIEIQKMAFEQLSKTGDEILHQCDEDGSVMEKLSSLSVLWNELMEKVRQRDIELEDCKVLQDITRDYNLLQSHLHDRMITMEKCNVIDEDDVQLSVEKKMILHTVRRDMLCDAERIKLFEEHARNVANGHNGISNEVNEMMINLKRSLNDLHDLNQKKSVSIQEDIDYKTFIQNSKNLLEKINNMIQQSTSSLIGSDLKSSKHLMREHDVIAAGVLQLRNTKDDLHAERDHLNPRFKVHVETILKQTEVSFAELDKMARERKQKLEAQHRLHAFFDDIKIIDDWIKNTSEELSQKSTLNTPEDIEMHYRKHSAIAIELTLQQKSHLHVQKFGEILLEEGRLTFIELEPKLEGLKRGFKNLKELLKRKEGSLNQTSLLKSLDKKCDYAEACLLRNDELRQSIDTLTNTSLPGVVRQLLTELKSMTCNLKKQQVEVNDVNATISSITNDEMDSECIVKRCESLLEKLQRGLETNLLKEKSLLDMLNLLAFKERLTQICELFDDHETQLASLKNSSSDNWTQNTSMHLEAKLKSYEGIFNEINKEFHRLSGAQQSECVSTLNNLHKMLTNLQEKSSSMKLTITNMLKSECLHKEIGKYQVMIDKLKKILGTFEVSEEKDVIKRWKKQLVDIKADLSSIAGKLDEMEISSHDGNLKQCLDHLLTSYKDVSEICEEKENIVKEACVFLVLKDEAAVTIQWIKNQREHVQSVDVGGNAHETDNLLMKIERLLVENHEIQHFKDETTKRSDDTNGVFARKIKQLPRDVESAQDEFRKTLSEKIAFLKRTHQIQKVMENQTLLSTVIKDKSLRLQDTDTGNDENSALNLLKRHQFLSNELQQISKDVQILDEQILQFGEWSEFQIYSTSIMHNQEILKSELRSVEVLIEKRSKMLEDAAKFFRFKTELDSINKWIRDQIGMIEIDFIGCTSTECDNLLKGTEKLVRNVLANEYRVTTFGELSPEILSGKPSTPVYEISRNVENVFEMWNDMKELLRKRLVKLEAAFKMHVHYERISQALQLCRTCMQHIGEVDLNFILGDLENAKKQHAKIQVDFLAVSAHVDALRMEEAGVTSTCQHLVEWSAASMMTFSKEYQQLEELYKEYESMLIDAERVQAYLADADRLCGWVDGFISNGNQALESLRQNKIDSQSSLIEFQKAFSDYKSYEENYDMLVEHAERLKRLMANCGDLFKSREAQVKRGWETLAILLEKWKGCVLECNNASDLLKDFEYIDNWISGQRESSLDFLEDGCNNNDDDVLDKIEEALKDQMKFERMLSVQEENIQRACLKFERFQRIKNPQANFEVVNSGNIIGNFSEMSVIGKSDSETERLQDGNIDVVSSANIAGNHTEILLITSPSSSESEKKEDGAFRDHSIEVSESIKVAQDNERKLNSLLKKSRSNIQKHVVFNTKHEMMDIFGKTTAFYRLNDEHNSMKERMKSDEISHDVDICFEDDLSVDDWSDSEDSEDVLIDMLPPPPQTFSDDGLFLQMEDENLTV